MKILSERQRRVRDVLGRAETPMTVTEIARAAYLPPNSARTAVTALVRYGVARVAGSAMSGGTTFTLTEKVAP